MNTKITFRQYAPKYKIMHFDTEYSSLLLSNNTVRTPNPFFILSNVLKYFVYNPQYIM